MVHGGGAPGDPRNQGGRGVNEGAGVALLVVAEEHLLLVQRAATEDVGFRHASGLHGVETGASVEVDGGGAVGGDGRHGGR